MRIHVISFDYKIWSRFSCPCHIKCFFHIFYWKVINQWVFLKSFYLPCYVVYVYIVYVVFDGLIHRKLMMMMRERERERERESTVSPNSPKDKL